MLKMKSLLWGILISLLFFMGFLVILSLITVKAGIMEEGLLRNITIILAALSILLGSGIASRMAREKGAVYGLIIGGIWFAITLMLSFLAGEVGNGTSLLIRGVIYLLAGFTGGIFGISMKKKSKYI